MSSEITQLIADARSLAVIANAGRKREDYPSGKEYADDCGELGQWLLADCLLKAARALELLAAEPTDATAIEFHARTAGLTTAYVLEEFERSKFIREVVQEWIDPLKAAHAARLKEVEDALI
jgi:hypothetical protein